MAQMMDIQEANKGSIRNKPLTKELYKLLWDASEKHGLRLVLSSGGQDELGKGNRRTGSQRHDLGFAGDFIIKDKKTGKVYNAQTISNTFKSNPNDPDVQKLGSFFEDIVKQGVTSIGGGGPGYMSGQGLWHIDIAKHRGIGGSRYWSTNNKATNSPNPFLVHYVDKGYDAPDSIAAQINSNSKSSNMAKQSPGIPENHPEYQNLDAKQLLSIIDNASKMTGVSSLSEDTRKKFSKRLEDAYKLYNSKYGSLPPISSLSNTTGTIADLHNSTEEDRSRHRLAGEGMVVTPNQDGTIPTTTTEEKVKTLNSITNPFKDFANRGPVAKPTQEEIAIDENLGVMAETGIKALEASMNPNNGKADKLYNKVRSSLKTALTSNNLDKIVPFIPNMVSAFQNIAETPPPVSYSPISLKRVSMDNSREAIKQATRNATINLDRQMDANSAQAVKQQSLIDSMRATSEVNERESLANTEIANQEISANAAIDQRNRDNIQAYEVAKVNRRDAKQQNRIAMLSSASDLYTASRNQQAKIENEAIGRNLLVATDETGATARLLHKMGMGYLAPKGIEESEKSQEKKKTDSKKLGGRLKRKLGL